MWSERVNCELWLWIQWKCTQLTGIQAYKIEDSWEKRYSQSWKLKLRSQLIALHLRVIVRQLWLCWHTWILEQHTRNNLSRRTEICNTLCQFTGSHYKLSLEKSLAVFELVLNGHHETMWQIEVFPPCCRKMAVWSFP